MILLFKILNWSLIRRILYNKYNRSWKNISFTYNIKSTCIKRSKFQKHPHQWVPIVPMERDLKHRHIPADWASVPLMLTQWESPKPCLAKIHYRRLLVHFQHNMKRIILKLDFLLKYVNWWFQSFVVLKNLLAKFWM